jgi:predicted NAD/FAD-dependent oxidoreductase
MATSSSRPKVIVAGAGVAGLTATLRLLERGYDVTLIEANNFVGGKLGAHRDRDHDTWGTTTGGTTTGKTCPGCEHLSGCLRPNDWHEHCYHMYLNWYHNFWELMHEVGTLDRFLPKPANYHVHRGDYNVNTHTRRAPPQSPIEMVNIGSVWTQLRNMFAGVAAPLDQFLWAQTMADLIGEPARRADWLDKTSITGFLKAQPYTTKAALAGTYRTTAQAFASPSYLSSARSFKALLGYGMRTPEPSMWMLSGNTQDAIFAPWLRHLALVAGTTFEVTCPKGIKLGDAFEAAMKARPTGYQGPGGNLTIRLLTSLDELGINTDTGRITHLMLAELAESPTVHRGNGGKGSPGPIGTETLCVAADDDVILALPLKQLGNLVTPDVAMWAPQLAQVRYLRTEPMISLDLFFKKKLSGIANGITVLLDSPYEMTFFDNSQTWTDLPPDRTVLNVIASNADTLVAYDDNYIIKTMLDELSHYIEYKREDLFDCRTHLQTNVGEELFVNQIGSWQWRPQATCGISNLYIAGDYCQTVIDVVTIEAAAVSGLMAAEALRRRRRVGRPIRLLQPDLYPVMAMTAFANSQRPFAYMARAVSSADDAIKGGYRQWFPNG